MLEGFQEGGYSLSVSSTSDRCSVLFQFYFISVKGWINDWPEAFDSVPDGPFEVGP